MARRYTIQCSVPNTHTQFTLSWAAGGRQSGREQGEGGRERGREGESKGREGGSDDARQAESVSGGREG